MSNPVWLDHFRYIDAIGPEGVSIICKRYVVIRETEHCYWLVVPSYVFISKASLERGVIPKYAKRVALSTVFLRVSRGESNVMQSNPRCSGFAAIGISEGKPETDKSWTSAASHTCITPSIAHPGNRGIHHVQTRTRGSGIPVPG